jgi:hypothetical protein
MLGGTVATPCPYCGSALVVRNFPPISHEEQHQQQYQTYIKFLFIYYMFQIVEI